MAFELLYSRAKSVTVSSGVEGSWSLRLNCEIDPASPHYSAREIARLTMLAREEWEGQFGPVDIVRLEQAPDGVVGVDGFSSDRKLEHPDFGGQSRGAHFRHSRGDCTGWKVLAVARA